MNLVENPTATIEDVNVMGEFDPSCEFCDQIASRCVTVGCREDHHDNCGAYSLVNLQVCERHIPKVGDRL